MNIQDFSDDAFAAYLAGFTDGEGYVGLIERAHNGLSARVTIANCVPEVLIAIRDRLGYGSIKSQHQRDHWRERYTYDVYNFIDCERFLSYVYPYLQIKQDAADKVLAYIAETKTKSENRTERNRQIRERAAAGEMRKSIAADFGVSPQTVSRLLEGHKWPSESSRYARAKARNTQGKFIRNRSHTPPDIADDLANH